MSLRQKTIVIIGLTFIGLTVLLYTISRFIVLVGFSQLEEKNISQNVTRARNVIFDELVGLGGTTHDWANWDDTYAFVEDANKQYIMDNLDVSAFINLRLNLMLFVDTSGHVVFGKAVDRVTEQEMPLPQDLLAQLSPDNLLLHHPDLKSSISGIILLPEDPMLVVSQPILTSAGTGPSRGTLITGRYLNASEIQHLAELAHLSLHLSRFDNSKVQAARTALSAEVPIFIQPLDTQTVVGYSLLTDIYGQPALIIQVDMPREIYQQGQTSISYLMGSLVAVGLVFGAIILLLLEQQVLSRLTRLSQRVSEIGASGDLSARVPTTSRDELSHLVRAINTMLGSLEQSEHALREQTRRNELILQTSLDGFMVLDINGQLREVNPAFCRILGYAHEELFGRHLSDFEVQENTAGTSQKRIEAILKTGADRFETKYCRQDGPLVDVEVSLNLATFGQDRFFFGFLRDISERKHIEEALAKEHNLLRTLIDNLPDSIYVKDTAGRHLLVNHATANGVAVITREAMLGKTDLDLYPLEVARQWYADDLAVIQSGQPLLNREEVAFDENAGANSWDLTTKIPLRDSSGKVMGLVGITRNITEHKRTEEALRASEERYRSLFENLPIAVMEQDFSAIKAFTRILQGQGINDFRAYFESHPNAVADCAQKVKLINLNKASLELYEASSKEELTRNLPQIFNQKSHEAFKDVLIAIAQGKTRLEQETINRTLKGNQKNLTLSWSVTPGYEETFSKVLVSLVDMTEYKKLEGQLRQSQKLEAIGRLAGGIAHDFNNILTVITGYTGLLLQNLDAHNPLSHDIGQIQKSAGRAAALTRQLLAFSRKQVLQPVVLDLNEIVININKLLPRLIGEDINLTTLLDPALGRIKADPGQIEQIILNLATNARDAMPQGGRLTIETKNIDLDDAYVQQHVDAKVGPYVMLTMSDTGSGMDEETRSHIFEPFFTTKEQGRGTGLGLATVDGIVDQSGGHISVYSERGHGTTIIIYLPRIEGEARPLTKPDLQRITPPKHNSETILLVEDEVSLRELACRVLLDEGYNVLEAAYGEEAMRVAQQHQGLIDLLLTDVVMPDGMSGRQLAEHLAPLRQGMKVLYMSGYTADTIIHHGVLEADIAFLQKPFTPNRLASKVREVLDAP